VHVALQARGFGLIFEATFLNVESERALLARVSRRHRPCKLTARGRRARSPTPWRAGNTPPTLPPLRQPAESLPFRFTRPCRIPLIADSRRFSTAHFLVASGSSARPAAPFTAGGAEAVGVTTEIILATELRRALTDRIWGASCDSRQVESVGKCVAPRFFFPETLLSITSVNEKRMWTLFL